MILGRGNFPDITWHDGEWWVVYQSPPEECRLVVKHWRSDGDGVEITLALRPKALAFARIASMDGDVWLAYADGEPDQMGRLLNLTKGGAWELGPIWGNDPICLGDGFVAWQRASDHKVMMAPADDLDYWTEWQDGLPTGLSRIFHDGEGVTIKTVDEDRVHRLGTRPAWDGYGGVVAEGSETGVALECMTRPLDLLWAGQTTYTPRIASAPPGDLVGVVTWTSKLEVLFEQIEADGVDATGEAVDILPFLHGKRLLAGTHLLQQDHDPAARTLTYTKFGDPSQFEVWHYDDEWVYHHEDHTNELGCYHFTDGRWIKRQVRWDGPGFGVSTRIEVWRDGRMISSSPFAYRNGVVYCFRNYPCGGAGRRDTIILQYFPNPKGPENGRIERFWFARDWGWWKWQAFDKKTMQLKAQSTFDREVGGPLVEPSKPWVPLKPQEDKVLEITIPSYPEVMTKGEDYNIPVRIFSTERVTKVEVDLIGDAQQGWIVEGNNLVNVGGIWIRPAVSGEFNLKAKAWRGEEMAGTGKTRKVRVE